MSEKNNPHGNNYPKKNSADRQFENQDEFAEQSGEQSPGSDQAVHRAPENPHPNDRIQEGKPNSVNDPARTKK